MNDIKKFMKESTEFGLKEKKKRKIPKKFLKILGIIIGCVIIIFVCLNLFKKINKKIHKNDARVYTYKLEKVTDFINDEVEFYDNFLKTDSGSYLEYRTNEGSTKKVFYDTKGKDVTKKILKSKVENIQISENDKLIVIEDNKKRTIISTNTLKKVAEFDNVSDWYGIIKNKYVLYKNDSNYGLAKLNGDVVIPFEYTYIKCDNNGVFALKNNELSIFDYNGKLITTRKFISSFSSVFYNTYELVDNVYVLTDNDNVGLISQGKTIGFDSKYNKFSYDNDLKVILAINDENIDLYDNKLELKKQIKLEDKKIYSMNYHKTDDELKFLNYFVDKDDNVYKLNKNLDLINLGKVMHEKSAENEFFYIYDDFMIKRVNDNKYAFYNYDNKKIIDKEFEYIEKRSNSYTNSDDSYEYFVVCLNSDEEIHNNCGIVNDKGKLLSELKYNYELYDNELNAIEMYNNEIVKYNTIPELKMNVLNKKYIIVNDNDKKNIMDSKGNYVIVNYNNYYGLFNDTAYLIELKLEDNQLIYELYDNKFNLITVENINGVDYKGYIGNNFFATSDGIYELKRY